MHARTWGAATFHRRLNSRRVWSHHGLHHGFLLVFFGRTASGTSTSHTGSSYPITRIQSFRTEALSEYCPECNTLRLEVARGSKHARGLSVLCMGTGFIRAV